MDVTTKLTSHTCYELWPIVWKKTTCYCNLSMQPPFNFKYYLC